MMLKQNIYFGSMERKVRPLDESTTVEHQSDPFNEPKTDTNDEGKSL